MHPERSKPSHMTTMSFKPEGIMPCMCCIPCCSWPCATCRRFNRDRRACQDELEEIVKQCVVSAEALMPLIRYTKEQNAIAVQGLVPECGVDFEEMDAFYNALIVYRSENYEAKDGSLAIAEAMQGFFKPHAEIHHFYVMDRLSRGFASKVKIA